MLEFVSILRCVLKTEYLRIDEKHVNFPESEQPHLHVGRTTQNSDQQVEQRS